MAQPNNYGITEEITLLKDTANRFYKDNYTDQSLHKLVASDYKNFDIAHCNWEPSHWRQMVDLGWSMLAIPEAAGGLGWPLVASTLLAEQTGFAGVPSPLIETLKSSYLLSACFSIDEKNNNLFNNIIEGQSIGLAVLGKDALYTSLNCEVFKEDNKLFGTAYFVQDAKKIDNFIVKVKTAAGCALYKVAANAKGLSIVADVISDLTRDQAHLIFDGVAVSEAELIANESVTEIVLSNSAPAIYTLTAADMVGSNEWLLQTTVEYAKTRVQFDRPIGFYQAVKHPLVNVMIANDEAKSLVYNAACAFDYEPEMALQYSHMAKASSADASAIAISKAIQLHGGIGITWECFVHIFAKRAKHNEILYGDGSFHRAKVAELLLD